MNEDIFATDTPPVLDAFSTPSMWYRANGIAAGAKRQRNVADYIPQLIRGVPPQAIAQAEKEDAQAKKAMEIAQGFASELDSLDPKQLDEMLKVGQAEGKVKPGAPQYQEPKMKGPGLVEMLISALGASGNPRFAPQILAAPFEAETQAYGYRKQQADQKYERETDAYNRQNALDMQLATLTANMDAKEAALVQRQAEMELKSKIAEMTQAGLDARKAQDIAMKEVTNSLKEFELTLRERKLNEVDKPVAESNIAKNTATTANINARTETENAMRPGKLGKLDAEINKIIGSTTKDAQATELLKKKVDVFDDEFKLRATRAYADLLRAEKYTPGKGPGGSGGSTASVNQQRLLLEKVISLNNAQLKKLPTLPSTMLQRAFLEKEISEATNRIKQLAAGGIAPVNPLAGTIGNYPSGPGPTGTPTLKQKPVQKPKAAPHLPVLGADGVWR